ncbi:hypothetical protein [Xanthomonas bundabergensis]|uniref:hypothetical protein n=1 Tax=Xanthomonas bundabergensis TaxID=3160842 RepID=UPI003516E5EF
MKIVLVVFFLTVQSSYLNDSEAEGTKDVFDTVQFLATDKGAWRIKTYATDQDVHVWSIGASTNDLVSLAHQNTEKHYGEVLSEGYIIQTSEGIDGLCRELRERGLSDTLEISNSGFLFWVPADTDYRSLSTPRHEP